MVYIRTDENAQYDLINETKKAKLKKLKSVKGNIYANKKFKNGEPYLDVEYASDGKLLSAKTKFENSSSWLEYTFSYDSAFRPTVINKKFEQTTITSSYFYKKNGKLEKIKFEKTQQNNSDEFERCDFFYDKVTGKFLYYVNHIGRDTVRDLIDSNGVLHKAEVKNLKLSNPDTIIDGKLYQLTKKIEKYKYDEKELLSRTTNIIDSSGKTVKVIYENPEKGKWEIGSILINEYENNQISSYRELISTNVSHSKGFKYVLRENRHILYQYNPDGSISTEEEVDPKGKTLYIKKYTYEFYP